MAPITINGNSLDPNPARTSGFGTGDASDSNYILIQIAAPLNKAKKTALQDLSVGVKEMVKVADSTYLCRYEPSDLSPVRDLDFVKWANIYPQHLVVSSDLKAAAHAGVSHAPSAQTPVSSKSHTVDVVFHAEHGKDASSLIAAVATAAHVDASSVSGRRDKVRLVMEDKYLEAVAKLDEVVCIEEVRSNKLFNNIARNIVMGFGNVADLNDIVIGSDKFRGQGQLVAVADTGVDSTHPAFTGRIKKTFPWGRVRQPGMPEDGEEGPTDDPAGHGTHVCGSVLGNGKTDNDVVVQGTAPEAELLMQSVVDDNLELGGIPQHLDKLFIQTYSAGARIHSDSWGDQQPGYSQSATEIDKFVYENPDMLICFAAGNAGTDRDDDGKTDLGQIGSQSAAKNCLTVGASESFRPELSQFYGNPIFADPETRIPSFKSAPIKNDKMANNSEGMAAFSSRGPTMEGRLKPDIVSPGTGILSARSIEADDQFVFGTSEDPKWMYDAGTSMATPLVAGCAAILREALVQKPPADAPNFFPTAALLKALLINGAVELKGQYRPSEAGPSPNDSSGWGRVQLRNSINSIVVSDEPGPVGYLEGKPLDDEEVFEFSIPVVKAGATLKVTLVWTDPDANAGIGALQNDLDLVVTVGGQEQHGNTGSDTRNNVQQVALTKVPKGAAKVRITAVELTKSPQAYAVAWSIA